MVPGIHNITVRKGDTWDGLSFALTSGSPAAAIDLTGAAIQMEIRKGNKTGTVVLTKNIASGITVTDDEGGTFTIDPFIPIMDAGKCYYDVQITLADDTVNTYLEGTFTITQDVTE